MTHNTDPDIEQLLQQYGADRRQQQTAADSVLYMARRQRRTVAGLASIVIVALAAAWLFRSTPDTATTLSATMRTPSVPQAPAIKKTPNDNLQTTTYQPTDTKPSTHKTHHITAALTPLHGTAQAESLALLPEPETMEKEKNDIPPCIVVPLSKGDGDAVCSSSYTQTEEYELTRQLENDSKLRVMAEVGAAMANTATLATPGNSRLQAGVGASLALADSKRYNLSLGVGISGDMRTDAPNMMHQKYDGNNIIGPNGIGVDNFSSDAEPVKPDPEYYILHPGLNPLFNLYATLPLTLDLYPRGRSHTGLQFTLTPARSVAASSSKSLLNPWKLSIGLGIALPQSPVRSIGLSANLLPSFTDGPYKKIHEIGLVIGF